MGETASTINNVITFQCLPCLSINPGIYNVTWGQGAYNGKGETLAERRGCKMKQALCLALFMMLIPLTGCATNTLGIDSGLFTDKPCKAPCWNGLTPGVSTAKDVDQFMQDLSTSWCLRCAIYERKSSIESEESNLISSLSV
jgi:hypothetical protein